jgi:hypothetical protein
VQKFKKDECAPNRQAERPTAQSVCSTRTNRPAFTHTFTKPTVPPPPPSDTHHIHTIHTQEPLTKEQTPATLTTSDENSSLGSRTIHNQPRRSGTRRETHSTPTMSSSTHARRVHAPRRTMEVDLSDDEPDNHMSVQRLRENVLGTTNSSSRVGGDDDLVIPAIGEGLEDDLVVRAKVKAKRPPAEKFDATLLRKPQGLPTLLNDARKYKFRGPGHEAKDLDYLLRNYSNWLHDVFPREGYHSKVRRLDKIKKEEIRAYIRTLRCDEVQARRKDKTEDGDVDLVSDGSDSDDDERMITSRPPPRDANRQPAAVIGTTTTTSALRLDGEINRPVSPALVSGVDSLQERMKRNREQAMARLRAKQAAAALAGNGAPLQSSRVVVPLSSAPTVAVRAAENDEPTEEELAMMESELHTNTTNNNNNNNSMSAGNSSSAGAMHDTVDSDEEAMADTMHSNELYQTQTSSSALPASKIQPSVSDSTQKVAASGAVSAPAPSSDVVEVVVEQVGASASAVPAAATEEAVAAMDVVDVNKD